MGDDSKIEWTDATWNPVTGCSKVSPGCAHCYAETLALGRLAGKEGYPGLPWTPENAEANVRVRDDRLDQPLRWRRPRMVFVNSMSDLFHDLIPREFIAQVFAVMAVAGQHRFQVLTKRPERARLLLRQTEFCELVESLADVWRGSPTLDPWPWPLPNVWMGTSIENRRYVGRADDLRATPAAVRFISAEPLLGPLLCEEEQTEDPLWADDYDGPQIALGGIDWLIVGGESGPKHRAMDMAWVRALYEATRCWRCREADEPSPPGIVCATCDGRGFTTAFFFKQLGGAHSGTALDALPPDLRVREFPARVGSSA